MEPFWRPTAPAKAVAGNLMYVSLMFLAAGDNWLWPQALALLATQAILFSAGGRAVMRSHPDLADEREKGLGHANAAGFDRVMMPVVMWLVPLTYWAAGLQRRFDPGSCAAPLGWQLAAAPAYVLGIFLQAWSLMENRFFSSVVRIQDDRGHAVCSSGPYAAVRHPGYVGLTLQAVAEGVLLQSCWAGAVAAARVASLVVRTALEDAWLRERLPGYRAYSRRVRSRLLPGVW